jgi:hypothetical protein
MTGKKPQFKVGDTVLEKFPSAIHEQGTVTEAYELAGDYRYVVRFENGREVVLFEGELISDDDRRTKLDLSGPFGPSQGPL